MTIFEYLTETQRLTKIELDKIRARRESAATNHNDIEDDLDEDTSSDDSTETEVDETEEELINDPWPVEGIDEDLIYCRPKKPEKKKVESSTIKVEEVQSIPQTPASNPVIPQQTKKVQSIGVDFSGLVNGIEEKDVNQNLFGGNNPEVNKFIQDMANAQQQTFINEQARHKVEGAPAAPSKKVEKVKGQPDRVDVDFSAVTPPEVVEAEPAKKADVIQPIPKVQPTENAMPIFVDNSEIYQIHPNKKDLLIEIEEAAKKSNMQVQFVSIPGRDGNPSGLISVLAFDANAQLNNFKSFMIDLGVIIDRREKLWPIDPSRGMCIEDSATAYELKVNGGEKGKKVINSKLLTDIFTGGTMALRPKDSMYTPDFIALNRLVALITINNNSAIRDKETKSKLRERLIKAMNAGVFDAALCNDPASRFRLEYFNSLDDFKLTTQGVPFRYTTAMFSSKVQELVFSESKVNLTVVS